MTIAELITALSTLDPATLVVVNGYEGGYADPEIKGPIPIKLNVNEAWYYGAHNDPKEDQTPDCLAVVIAR